MKKVKEAAGQKIRKAFDAISENGTYEKAAEIVEDGELVLTLWPKFESSAKVKIFVIFYTKI